MLSQASSTQMSDHAQTRPYVPFDYNDWIAVRVRQHAVTPVNGRLTGVVAAVEEAVAAVARGAASSINSVKQEEK